MRLGGALGGDTTWQHWRGRGDTVSPPSPPTGCYHGHGEQGREKLLCVMGGRSYTLELFCLYRLGFWRRARDGLNLAF